MNGCSTDRYVYTPVPKGSFHRFIQLNFTGPIATYRDVLAPLQPCKTAQGWSQKMSRRFVNINDTQIRNTFDETITRIYRVCT